MDLLGIFKDKKGSGNGDERSPSKPLGPAVEGEILFVDTNTKRGMLNTEMPNSKTKMALSFSLSECRGFTPKTHNIVAVDRIDGMQAFGLTLVSEVPSDPEPRFTHPQIPDGAVEAILNGAQTEPTLKPMSPKVPSSELSTIDWEGVFTEINRTEDGLDAKTLATALAEIQRPFEKDEIEEMMTIEPETISFQNTLARIEDRWPVSWLSFLSWSNGGEFVNGERGFQDMFSVEQVREYTICYGIGIFLRGAVPFAMDGAGNFYMFDTRKAPVSGEYPIVFCHSSELDGGWDGVIRLENSFLECCQATTDPVDVG